MYARTTYKGYHIVSSTLAVQKSNDDEQITHMKRVSCGVKTTVYGVRLSCQFLSQLVNAEMKDKTAS